MLIATFVFIVQGRSAHCCGYVTKASVLHLLAASPYLSLDLSSRGGAQAWTYNYSTSPNRRWPEASQWCRQHFTAMASMQNEEERDFLIDMLPFNPKYYWIGVRRDGEAWLRDGSDQKVPKDAQDWAPEEPDDIGGQDCVEVYIKRDKDTDKWNNENCRKKKGTVCYSGKALLLHSFRYRSKANADFSWRIYAASCRPDSCGERANCVETVGGYSCQCHPGFQGPRCENGQPPSSAITDLMMTFDFILLRIID